MKHLYLVDIKFRYSDWNNEDERSTSKSKTVTIGIFNTYEEAAKAGNEMLETELESRFPLNRNWRKRDRFGNQYTMNLISELSYLEMPFSFFAHIKKLEISSVSDAINEALKAQERYKQGKEND